MCPTSPAYTPWLSRSKGHSSMTSKRHCFTRRCIQACARCVLRRGSALEKEEVEHALSSCSLVTPLISATAALEMGPLFCQKHWQSAPAAMECSAAGPALAGIVG